MTFDFAANGRDTNTAVCSVIAVRANQGRRLEGADVGSDVVGEEELPGRPLEGDHGAVPGEEAVGQGGAAETEKGER